MARSGFCESRCIVVFRAAMSVRLPPEFANCAYYAAPSPDGRPSVMMHCSPGARHVRLCNRHWRSLNCPVPHKGGDRIRRSPPMMRACLPANNSSANETSRPRTAIDDTEWAGLPRLVRAIVGRIKKPQAPTCATAGAAPRLQKGAADSRRCPVPS
jgi:hypothetical protein